MIIGQWSGRNMEGSGRGIIGGTIPEFGGETEYYHENNQSG
jgi:hypothetical protein